VATLGARDAFGEGAILAGRPVGQASRTATVAARARTRLLKLKAEVVQELLPLGLDEALVGTDQIACHVITCIVDPRS